MLRADRVGFVGFAMAAVLLVVLATPALGALPRTYDVQRIDSPNPQPGGLFSCQVA